MALVLRFVEKVDRINTFLAQGVSWFLPAMALLSFLIVSLRYTLGIGWVWSQEIVIYMHGSLLMLGMAHTLLKEGHVRVDIFYRDLGPRRQALIDIIGSLGLLFPFCLLFLIYALPYVWESWRIWEDSPQAGGLPKVYLFKTLLLLMPLMLLMQGVSLGIKSFLVLFGKGITTPMQWSRNRQSKASEMKLP